MRTVKGVIKVEFVDVLSAFRGSGPNVYAAKLDAWKVTVMATTSNFLQIYLNGANISPLCDISGTLGAGHLALVLGGAVGPDGPISMDDVLEIRGASDYEYDTAQALVLVKEYYVPNRPGPDAVDQVPITDPVPHAYPGASPRQSNVKPGPVRSPGGGGRFGPGSGPKR